MVITAVIGKSPGSSALAALLLSIAIATLGAAPAHAADSASATTTESSSIVERLDPELDRLIAPDAKLETVYTKADTFFEGPTWNARAGYLMFTDVPGNVINRLDSDGSVSVLLGNIFSGGDLSHAWESLGSKKVRMPGANGTTLDAQGRLVYCAWSDGQIVRLEADGKRTVLASRFGDDRLNALNDLVYGPDGSLYFTDSRASTVRADGNDEGSKGGAGVPHEGLYVLKAGTVSLLSKEIDHPNGVALSPDGKVLYVTNSRKKNILRYDVTASGAANPRISNETMFVDMSADPRDGGPDGVKTDREGHVYATGPGGLWILTAQGKHLGTVRTPGSITNVALGDRDLRSLYITGSGALYRIRVRNAGVATH